MKLKKEIMNKQQKREAYKKATKRVEEESSFYHERTSGSGRTLIVGLEK